MSYWIKNDDGAYVSAYTVNISADSETSYVSVCWLGVICDDSNSCIADDIQTYCESIYIGLGECSGKTSSGTIKWPNPESGDCIINYTILQESAKCESCDEVAPSCEFIEAYVSPYIIPYAQSSTSEVHYSYWDYEVNSDCEIVRTRVDKSIPIEFAESATTIPCSAETRIISSSFTLDCGGEMSFDFYVQMPDNCCDTPSGVCYEVGEVYYINSAGTLITDVSPSGETIYFYFDYKKNETDDKCNTKTRYGRFDSKQQNIPWVISGCVGSDCCKTSGVTSEFVWSGHTTCGGSGDTKVPLEITRRKDVNYSGDCTPSCSADTTYCVDSGSVMTYYRDTSGEWIEITDGYIFPYYGGTMKSTWEYSAFTIYDDCTSAFTSGNTWEDIVDILPYSGECGDGEEEITIPYEFKKGNSGCTNEFHVTYKQYRKPCGDECGSCINDLYLDTSGDTGNTSVSATVSCTFDQIEFISKPDWVTGITEWTANTEDSGIISGLTFDLISNSGATREGGVIYQLLNYKECYDTVIIAQSGSSQDSSGDTPDTGDTPVVCDCDSTFDVRSISKIPSDGGYVRIASYIFDECIPKSSIKVGSGYVYTITCEDYPSFSIECEGSVSFSSGQTGPTYLIPSFVVEGTDVTFEDDGFVYAHIQANTQPFERTGYLAVSYDGCNKTIQVPVTQEKGKCSSYLEVDGSVCNDVGGSLTIKIENG